MTEKSHLELEAFNLLLENAISDSERARLVEHILDCDGCARKFRMLRELRVESAAISNPRKTTRPPLRYVLGVAAILIMSVFPYLSRSPESAAEPGDGMLASRATASEPFSVLAEVNRVNYRHALANWGRDTDLTDLVAIQNQRH